MIRMERTKMNLNLSSRRRKKKSKVLVGEIIVLICLGAMQQVCAWRLFENMAESGRSFGSPAFNPAPNSQLLIPLTSNANHIQQPANEPLKFPSESGEEKRESVSVAKELSARDVGQSAAAEAASQALPIAGKILNAALDVANQMVAASNVSGEAPGKISSAISAQLLKPANKRSGAQTHQVVAAKPSAAAIEQQIINQHARVHLSGGSHQRLLPSKQRDNRIISLLYGDSSAVSSYGQRTDSQLLSSLLGNLKSGISARSSIVKAISDNKLARTISSVGKSISGNKYVAGAAAASALAALGLSMSKLLGPYLYSSGYSKLSDPMMSSSSFLNPATTDRNLMYLPPDSKLTSSSSFNPMRTTSAYTEFPYEPNGASSSAFETSPQQSYYAPSQQFYQPAGQSQVYVTYAPKDASKKNPEGADGHYANFYSQQPSTPSDSQILTDSYSSYYSQAPAESSIQQQFADQLIPSSSFEAPVYTRKEPQKFAVTSNSRRSGAVSLKMNEATKARLEQYFKKQKTSPSLTNQNELLTSPAIFKQQQKPLSFSPADSIPFVPMTTNQLSSPFKSIRAEPDGFDHAPVSNNGSSSGSLKSRSQAQQGQLSSPVALMFIRPKTNKFLATTAAPSSNSWKSFEGETQELHWPAKTAIQQRDNNEPDKEVAPSSPKQTTTNGQQQASLMHRLSRTPTKAPRHPIESLTDYESGGGGGGVVNEIGSSSSQAEKRLTVLTLKKSAGSVAEETTVDKQQVSSPTTGNEQAQLPQVVVVNDGDNAKTGFEQEQEKTNNNDNNSANSNVIKLIEANVAATGGSKQAKFGDMLIMLPSRNPQQEDSPEAEKTSFKAVADQQTAQQVAADQQQTSQQLAKPNDENDDTQRRDAPDLKA